MKRVIVFIAAALILTGCASGEPQEIRGPVTVEQAREAAKTEVSNSKTEMPDLKSKMEIAPAAVVTSETIPAEDPLPEMPVSEAEMSVLTGKVIEIEETCPEEPEMCADFPEGDHGNYYEGLPDETSLAYQTEETGMQLLGVYHITHYSAEACENAIGAAEVDGGMVEGISIAMPEAWMLGCWVYVEGYGQFRVDDISPDGVADIFHWYTADAVGNDYQNVYLMEGL